MRVDHGAFGSMNTASRTETRRRFSVDNWGEPENLGTAFQHMQELFPTARIRRAPAVPDTRSLRETEFGNLAFDALGTVQTVGTMLATTQTDAFLVAHRGVLLSELYFNGMDADQHHQMNSITKSLVGMLAGHAVAEGQLDVHAPITHYVPELVGSAWDGTQVRHVLDMTAGVTYAEDYDDPRADFWRETAVVGWRPALAGATTPATLLEYAASLRGKDFADGEKFSYKTVATNVIGLVLERAMDDSMVHLLSRHFWSRLPMRNDAVIVVDRCGFPYVGAGMSACARDLVTFGQMMIEGGTCNGQQVVPEAWIRDTQAGGPTSRQEFAAGQYGGLFPGWHYRNQVWCADRPGVMLAIGIHGQLIYMNTRSETVVVKLSSQPTAVDIPCTVAGILAADAIAESLA